MNKKNWLCKIWINGRMCFSDYITNDEVINLILSIDSSDVHTFDGRDGKQDIVIINRYIEININEM